MVALAESEQEGESMIVVGMTSFRYPSQREHGAIGLRGEFAAFLHTLFHMVLLSDNFVIFMHVQRLKIEITW